MPTPPSPATVAAARKELAALDPALARVNATTPVFEWRVRPGGYEGLLHLIVYQQVSLASAAAIWARTVAGLGGAVTPEAILSHDIEALRGFGLSLPKARYAHEIARARIEGRIDFEGLEALSDDQALTALLSLRGVGRWTAETFLMFAHSRTDLFPAGDVALQEAIRWADARPIRPDERQARFRAEIWRPHRGVAAHLLWRWYGGVKRGEIPLNDA